MKDTFTDHDKLWPGDVVCQACLFCTDDHNVVLQGRVGREKPQRMRNYSHVVTRTGRWQAWMKNDKRAIAAALLDRDDPPLVAIVSLAGQKHLIMRARIGWWQIEEQTMAPAPAPLAALLAPVTVLYAAGASKAMIESGEYSAGWLRTADHARWWAAEQAIRIARGSLVFSLAVWLAQKDDEEGRRK